MIFVTVGTTHFDQLIEAVDDWHALNLEVEVTCQIGSGKYIPKTCDYIRFAKTLDSYIENSSIIVTHGGATVIDMIRRKKRFIACANTALSGDHQSVLLKTLSEFCSLVWTDNVVDVAIFLDRFILEGDTKLGVVEWEGPSLQSDLISYINDII